MGHAPEASLRDLEWVTAGTFVRFVPRGMPRFSTNQKRVLFVFVGLGFRTVFASPIKVIVLPTKS
jgi:hypothetical protein